MASRPAQQALVVGRAVLLADARTGMPELAVILGEPPAASAPRAAPSAGSTATQAAYPPCDNSACMQQGNRP